MILRRLAWSCFLTTLAVPMALADTLMVMREGAGMSEDAAGKVYLWSGKNQIASISGSTRMIGDLTAGMLYIANDEDRTCSAMPLRDTDHDRAALKAAVEAVDVRKTGKSERIGPWQAEVHELIAGVDEDLLEMVVWVTDEFDVDPVQRAYMESVATPETAAMLAIYELGGFPVRSEARMGPIQTWTELESIEEKPAPAGTYEIPKGYSGCESAGS